MLTLIDQVDALKASVTAFNKNYKGVGGHCMNLTACDDKADPNTAADCARKLVDSKVVATLNDTTSFGSKDVSDILQAAGIPRVGVSPGTDELADANSYVIGAGGVGTTFMMAPPLLQTGHKKLYMIGVDAPTIEADPAADEADGRQLRGGDPGPVEGAGRHDRLPAVRPRGSGRRRRRRDAAPRRQRSGAGARRPPSSSAPSSTSR